MDRVRLMTWCPNVHAGLQLPAFAAAEGGLFAERGLEVELVRGASIPDFSLCGLSQRIKAVAAGDADFAITSVAYLHAAQHEAGGHLRMRFAAMFHQRSPGVALVRAASDLREPADLQGARTARWSMPWYARDFAGALAHRGLRPPVMVPTAGDNLDAALGNGHVDVIPTWRDWLTFYERDTTCPVRVIEVGAEVYATGLLATDRLPLDIVTRVRDAFAAGYELHRRRPEPGIAAFRRRFPDISDEHIRANWALFEPYAFDRAPPCSMDPRRWEETAAYTAATHELRPFAAERMYRPELAAAAARDLVPA